MVQPHRASIVGIAAITLASSACLAPTIISATRPPKDDTVIARELVPKRRVMVIPPSGTARGQFDSEIALFEREFLKGGVTVISGAITGRVVLDSATEKRSEAAAGLSDAERALVMAKQTGADAILQIGELTWSKSEIQTRFFVCCTKTEPGYREVAEAEYQNWSAKKVALTSPQLTFVGRLIDVETGEVLALFHISAGANFSLQDDERLVIPKGAPKRGPIVISEFRDWDQAKRRTVERVIEVVVQRTVKKAF